MQTFKSTLYSLLWLFFPFFFWGFADLFMGISLTSIQKIDLICSHTGVTGLESVRVNFSWDKRESASVSVRVAALPFLNAFDLDTEVPYLQFMTRSNGKLKHICSVKSVLHDEPQRCPLFEKHLCGILRSQLFGVFLCTYKPKCNFSGLYPVYLLFVLVSL